MLKFIIVFIPLVILSGCSQSPTTQKSAIKARQDLMHNWRSANDIIKGMSENPANFDKAILKEQLDYLNDSQAQMWAYFKDNTKGNRVNELIHANSDNYQKMIDEFNHALNALNNTSQTASDINDIKPLIDELNKSCKNCHKVYKKM